jgi:hypothetical protein
MARLGLLKLRLLGARVRSRWRSECGRCAAGLRGPASGSGMCSRPAVLMYLQAIVVGADRIDLDGNAAGQVDTAEAGHAIAVLVGILAARAAQRKAVTRPVIAPAASPPVAKPADVVLLAARGLKHKPVLHLGQRR